MRIDIPLSLSGDRELKGSVNESQMAGIFAKELNPSSVHLVKYDEGSADGFMDLSAEITSPGLGADTPVLGTNTSLSANDEFYIADEKQLKEFWSHIRVNGSYTATGIEMYDSTDGVTFNRKLAGLVDDSNGFRAGIGWHKTSWTQPATASQALALVPISSKTYLNTKRIWYKVKIVGFTSAVTAPVLARIIPVFIDAEQNYIDYSAFTGISTTSHAGHPRIGVSFFPLIGDEIVYSFSNRARGISFFMFLNTVMPAGITQVFEYLATDNLWKAISSVNDGTNFFRNGPATLTQPPTHFDFLFETPTDWTSKTISLKTNTGTVSSTGFHIRSRLTGTVIGEYPAAVYSFRGYQYGTLNTDGIALPAMTIRRVSMEVGGSVTGTATAATFSLVNLSNGNTVHLTVPATAGKGSIVNADVTDIIFADGEMLGIERTDILGRNFTNLAFNIF